MATEEKPLVVVTGITGKQGTSTALALLATGKYRVRGLTRNPGGENAAHWEEKGVEILRGDLNNKDELVEALRGAFGVFAMTNFGDAVFVRNTELEFHQGQNLVDAAIETGVKHYIWSGLHDVEKITQGRLNVPHFTAKKQVEDYIREQQKKHPQLLATFLYLGFYASNFVEYARKDADGTLVFAMGLEEGTKLPVFDVNDTGAFVVEAFEKGSQYNGKVVLIAAEYISVPEVAATYTRVTGKPARFEQVRHEDIKRDGFPEEYIHTLRWYNEYGYFNREPIDEARSIVSTIGTFEDWLKRSGWKGELKQKPSATPAR